MTPLVPEDTVEELLAAVEQDAGTGRLGIDEIPAVIRRRVVQATDLTELKALLDDLISVAFYLEDRHRSANAADAIMSYVRGCLPKLEALLQASVGADLSQAKRLLDSGLETLSPTRGLPPPTGFGARLRKLKP